MTRPPRTASSWTVEETASTIEVRDRTGRCVVCLRFDPDPLRAFADHCLSREEARRIAERFLRADRARAKAGGRRSRTVHRRPAASDAPEER